MCNMGQGRWRLDDAKSLHCMQRRTVILCPKSITYSIQYILLTDILGAEGMFLSGEEEFTVFTHQRYTLIYNAKKQWLRFNLSRIQQTINACRMLESEEI